MSYQKPIGGLLSNCYHLSALSAPPPPVKDPRFLLRLAGVFILWLTASGYFAILGLYQINVERYLICRNQQKQKRLKSQRKTLTG